MNKTWNMKTKYRIIMLATLFMLISLVGTTAIADQSPFGYDTVDVPWSEWTHVIDGQTYCCRIWAITFDDGRQYFRIQMILIREDGAFVVSDEEDWSV